MPDISDAVGLPKYSRLSSNSKYRIMTDWVQDAIGYSLFSFLFPLKFESLWWFSFEGLGKSILSGVIVSSEDYLRLQLERKLPGSTKGFSLGFSLVGPYLDKSILDKPEGSFEFYLYTIQEGFVQCPFFEFEIRVLNYLCIAPSMTSPNSWLLLGGFQALCNRFFFLHLSFYSLSSMASSYSAVDPIVHVMDPEVEATIVASYSANKESPSAAIVSPSSDSGRRPWKEAAEGPTFGNKEATVAS
ncbi:hypothetical protein G2W53_026742 [Senna tora]|uniref:Uncharacterized protein n=1 Tax=Senna tora TaxID=362788 RepID=A0A834WFY1_9FABA|nr:hypothetical protein G2W53_026742 [Senna tora]